MRPRGSIPIIQMFDFLADDPMVARLVLRRNDSGLELRHMVADRLPVSLPPTELHDYGEIIFVCETVTPGVIRNWFENREGVIAGQSFVVAGERLVRHIAKILSGS